INWKTSSLDFGRPCHPYEEPRSDKLGPRKQYHCIVLTATLFPQYAATRHDLHGSFEHLLPIRFTSEANNASWKSCLYSTSCQTLWCAFLKAAGMQAAVNGFKQTGVFPLNREFFSDHLFAPSITTDRPFPPDASNILEENLFPAANPVPTETHPKE
ncbi:hypothetical protein AVEN_37985-1, partial [Araneus ventricosus]